MKHIILLFISIGGMLAVPAQTLEQGIQQLYYERYQTAENTFHQVLHENPNNSVAWYYLAKDYLLEDSLGNAIDSIQLAPADVKADPWYKVGYGTLLLQEGKKAEASGYFTDAIKDTKEKDAAILAAVADAQIQSKTGDANYAIDLLNKAIKRDKKNASLYVLLGDAYMKASNGSEAFKATNRQPR